MLFKYSAKLNIIKYPLLGNKKFFKSYHPRPKSHLTTIIISVDDFKSLTFKIRCIVNILTLNQMKEGKLFITVKCMPLSLKRNFARTSLGLHSRKSATTNTTLKTKQVFLIQTFYFLRKTSHNSEPWCNNSSWRNRIISDNLSAKLTLRCKNLFFFFFPTSLSMKSVLKK